MNMVVEHPAAETAGNMPLKSSTDNSGKAREAVRKLTAMPKEYLSFKLGDEEYGIDILRVQEIRSYEPPTRIANSPSFIKGVVNLRGVIVPIVDLRLKLACTSVEYTDCTVVIVLNVHHQVVGVVVDSVSDVLALTPDEIKTAPEMHSAVDAGFIMGMGCIKSGDVNRMLILTDIIALMRSEDMGLMDVAMN